MKRCVRVPPASLSFLSSRKICLVHEADLAAVLDVIQHFLLEIADGVFQPLDHVGQLGVLALQVRHLRVELRDALQLPFPALGSCQTVPLPLSVELALLLVLLIVIFIKLFFLRHPL